MAGKRLIWKTFSIARRDDLRRLQSAWASSSQAFGKGRVLTFGADIETNLPIRDLRTLLRHAGVRIPGGLTNGIIWDTMSLDERAEHEKD